MDGSGAEALNMPAGGSRLPATHETLEKKLHFLYQDGKTLFKQAVTIFADVSAKVLENNGLTPNDLQLLIPHQANQRIMESVAKKLALDMDQLVVNIERYGNTTAATLPIAMSEAHASGRMKPGDWILLSALGAGYTAGTVRLKWSLG
jgi:3-oxoacyl-[acyl-carrier-protein] synthase-3